jgi:hypothetical protein
MAVIIVKDFELLSIIYVQLLSNTSIFAICLHCAGILAAFGFVGGRYLAFSIILATL